MTSLFLSCVVPAHNEIDNIEQVFEVLTATFQDAPILAGYTIIIVDDNSTDGTGALAEQLAKDPHVQVIHRTENPGYGNAVKAGVSAALQDPRVEVIGSFSGDLSDDPKDLLLMVEKVAHGYDVVYGSRFIAGGELYEYPKAKWIANRAFNHLIRLLFGIPHKDITNGFKAYRREVLEEVKADASAFDLTIEIPLKAYIAGFSSCEVPVSWHNRTAGEAKLILSQNGTIYTKQLIRLFVRGGLLSVRDLAYSVMTGSWLWFVASIFIGMCIFTAIFALFGFADIIENLKEASISYLILCCFIMFGGYLLRTWRWSVIFRSNGYTVPRDLLFKALMFGALLNYLLPARIGDIGRGIAIKTASQRPLGVTMSTIVIERAFDTFSLAIMLLVVGSMAHAWLFAGSLVLTALLVGLLAIVYYNKKRITSLFFRFIPNIEASITALNDGLRMMAKNIPALGLCFILSVIIWISDILCLWVAALALHHVIPFAAATVSGIAAFIAQSLPLTPAGIGVHEGAIVSMLLLFDIPAQVGMAVALADHAVRAIVIYVVGILCTIHLGFASRAYFRSLKR